MFFFFLFPIESVFTAKRVKIHKILKRMKMRVVKTITISKPPPIITQVGEERNEKMPTMMMIMKRMTLTMNYQRKNKRKEQLRIVVVVVVVHLVEAVELVERVTTIKIMIMMHEEVANVADVDTEVDLVVIVSEVNSMMNHQHYTTNHRHLIQMNLPIVFVNKCHTVR